MQHTDKLKKQKEVLIKNKRDLENEYQKKIFQIDGQIEGLDMAIKMCEESDREITPIQPTDDDVLNCVKEYLKDHPRGINRINKSIPPLLKAKNFQINGIDIESIIIKSNMFTTVEKNQDGKRSATYWILKEDNNMEIFK